jgi:hypothetical protein
MNFLKFVDAVIRDSGASYNLVTSELNPSEGFMVSRIGHEKQVPYNPDSIRNDVAEYVKEKIGLLLEDDAYLGAWVSSGVLYLDISDLIYNRDAAVILGEHRQQQAIYDNGNKEVLRTA